MKPNDMSLTESISIGGPNGVNTTFVFTYTHDINVSIVSIDPTETANITKDKITKTVTVFLPNTWVRM